MVTVGLAVAGVCLASAVSAIAGYVVGRHGDDEDQLKRADALESARALAYKEGRIVGYRDGTREAERRCDEMYAEDWDRGYNLGLEIGRGEASPDPVVLTHTATAVREARLKWIRFQMEGHLSTYHKAFWRALEVARDIGQRYRKVESSGVAGLVPIGDALNVCVYVADIAEQYDDNRILTRPHQGVFEGRAS